MLGGVGTSSSSVTVNVSSELFATLSNKGT